jgi:RNA-directed DNA polymerase
VLKQFLEAGYINDDELNKDGTISPIIANLTLDGLQLIAEVRGCGFVRYADDFLIIGENKRLLELMKDEIGKFLAMRGLSLNFEKSKLIHSSVGVEYLGYELRVESMSSKKYICYTRPNEKSLKRLKDRIAEVSKRHDLNIEEFIKYFNSITLGFVNYFKLSRNEAK